MRPVTEIEADLTVVRTSITRVVTGGQEYTFDTGQTEQRNKRASLKDLRELRDDLESELSLANSVENRHNRGVGDFSC